MSKRSREAATFTMTILGRNVVMREDVSTVFPKEPIMLMWTMLKVPISNSAFRTDCNHIVLLAKSNNFISESDLDATADSNLNSSADERNVAYAGSEPGSRPTQAKPSDSSKQFQPTLSAKKVQAKLSSKNVKPMCTTKQETNRKYPWLYKTADGYLCSCCMKHSTASHQSKGVWVTTAVKCDTSKQLYKKAKKHAMSPFHLLATTAEELSDKSRRGSAAVHERIITAANKQADGKDNSIKCIFRCAYFLFTSEIAHTTNWRGLISTVASCDSSGNLQKFFEQSPANAHHLSTTSSTDILEAYGVAMSDNLRARVGGCKEFAVMADESTNCKGQEMCSVCIRFFEHKQVKEVFLGCWLLQSTKAVSVHKCILDALRQFDLNPANVVAAAFDGASNMSGQHGGVQALLRSDAPELIFVHCRSHVLQLATVKATRDVPEVKRIIGILNKLYAFFQNSPLRLGALKTVQMAIDGQAHKLVQPCETRWLSNAGSVKVILQHYAAILVALESLYVDAGDLSSDAGGLLLTMRKPSTLFFMTLLHSVLEPLARLSKCLQSSEGNISKAMSVAKAVVENISDCDLTDIQRVADDTMQKVASGGGRMVSEDDLTPSQQLKVGKTYLDTIVKQLKLRFSDRVSDLSMLQDILEQKQADPDFGKVASVLNVSKLDLEAEWRILRRLTGSLSSQDALLDLGLSLDKQSMFPHFSAASRKLLLLPIGTATVERSFSTLNRIMNSSRCRLNPSHTCQLMQMSIEGPSIPDVRCLIESDKLDHTAFKSLTEAAIEVWQSKPRRFMAHAQLI